MNEKELFDALAKDCPNELAKHDATVIDDFANFLCKRIPYAELSIPQLVEEFKKEKKK